MGLTLRKGTSVRSPVIEDVTYMSMADELEMIINGIKEFRFYPRRAVGGITEADEEWTDPLVEVIFDDPELSKMVALVWKDGGVSSEVIYGTADPGPMEPTGYREPPAQLNRDIIEGFIDAFERRASQTPEAQAIADRIRMQLDVDRTPYPGDMMKIHETAKALVSRFLADV